MSPSAILNVIFCDDNNQFVSDQVESILHKMQVRYGMGASCLHIIPITNINEIQNLISNPQKLATFDMVFCDLGWSELTLKGVQILHDIKMAHPGIYAVLYTAQDEDAIISQALGWQFDFVDCMIKIEGKDYFEEMIAALHEQFVKKIVSLIPADTVGAVCELLVEDETRLAEHCRSLRIGENLFRDLFPQCAQLVEYKNKLSASKAKDIYRSIQDLIDRLVESQSRSSDIIITGQNHLESTKGHREKLHAHLATLKKEMTFLFELNDAADIAADISLSKAGMQIKFKPDPKAHLVKRYLDLLEKIENFPKIEDADLLALNKFVYIEFIKKKYGGFPQMAEARSLDLNNIYRVNRRFKQSPFVVFQCFTVREIVGVYDRAESDQIIKNLLATKDQIYEVIHAQK